MPIDRREFEAGGKAYSSALDFLKANQDMAFTLSEVVAALEPSGFGTDDVDAVLRSLEQQESIDVRMVENRVYYRYRIPLGYRRG